MCTLPVVGGDKAEIEDTTTRSVLMSDKKLPTLPDCVIDNWMVTALIACDFVATQESLVQKCNVWGVPPILRTKELL
jgi:hypothetical protein